MYVLLGRLVCKDFCYLFLKIIIRFSNLQLYS